MVKLEASQPIINSLPHLTWHLTGIIENEWLWPAEGRPKVRGYEGIPGDDDEPHELRGSKIARQECVRPRAVKDRVWISYNEMMSIYPGVCQI
jgi:hypothetical protein